MRHFTRMPFLLTVGDCGSSDGSLEMLRRLERRGWLTLEVSEGWRRHAEWIDLWRRACEARYAVFVDSDIEFLALDWLEELIATAERHDAALVTAEMVPEVARFFEPVAGRTMRVARRPAPWLLLVDCVKTTAVETSFVFSTQETESVPEGLIGYDVGAAFYGVLGELDLACPSMPASYRKKYRHYGGLSWRRDTSLRRRIIQRVRIARGLRRARLRDRRARTAA